jgi:hypothetical protein
MFATTAQKHAICVVAVPALQDVPGVYFLKHVWDHAHNSHGYWGSHDATALLQAALADPNLGSYYTLRPATKQGVTKQAPNLVLWRELEPKWQIGYDARLVIPVSLICDERWNDHLRVKSFYLVLKSDRINDDGNLSAHRPCVPWVRL